MATACFLALAPNAFADSAITITRPVPFNPPGWTDDMFVNTQEDKSEFWFFYGILWAMRGMTLGAAWSPDAFTEKPAAPGPIPRVEAGDPGAKEGPLVRAPIAIGGSGCVPQSSAAVHPDQRLIYVATASGTQGFICAYRFDPVAQTLTPVPGSPFPTGGTPDAALAIEPSGTFLYSVASEDSGVAAFSINGQTGALIPIVGSPFATPPNPLSVVADPTGRYVYVATRANKTSASTITGYAIDAATGVLTPLPGSPYPVPNNAFKLAMDPVGRYVYLTGDKLQVYAINAGTGALTPVGAAVSGYGNIAVDPAGRFVYVKFSQFTAPKPTDGVLAYKVEANGSLTPMGGFNSTGANVRDIAVSRSGRHVYVVNRDEKADFSGFVTSIAALKRDEATGTLAPIAGSPYLVGSTVMLAGQNVLPSQSGWVAGEPMFYPLGVYGGYPPYTWSVASGNVPPGLGVDATLGALRGTPTSPGIYEFVARVTDSRGSAATKSYRFTVSGASLPAFATVVEFYNQSLDHYFITWLAAEISALDAGTQIRGWTRTGRAFNVWISVQPGSTSICRYYIPPNLGDSHFFGRGSVECNATGAANPSFILEEPAFMHMLLPAAGTCPANATPVYRVFSNRPDANHRYMTDRALRNEMVAKGWLAEGDGPDLVVMCAPN